MSEINQQLKNILDISLDRHTRTPAKYYLGEGNHDYVSDCQQVFYILKKAAMPYSEEFFKSDQAIPVHPLFIMIKNHFDKIRYIYSSKDASVILLFLKCLLPSNPYPLRPSVLRSISLFSARVYIHEQELSPAPVQSFIDGLHSPLLLPDGETSKINPNFPESIRFIAMKEDGAQLMKDYIIKTPPIKARSIQLDSFISIFSTNKPFQDYLIQS